MKFLVVDDHSVVREGVRRLLSLATSAEIFEAGSGEEASSIFQAEKPEIVILDLNLPGAGGLDLLKRFLAQEPRTRILIFSMHSSTHVRDARDAGWCLWLHHQIGQRRRIAGGNRQVMAGSHYMQRDLVTELAGSTVWTKGPKQPLSSRELDIMRLLSQGQTLSEIATNLGVSYKTIANSCTGIKDKLNVERTGDLIRLAIEMHSGR